LTQRHTFTGRPCHTGPSPLPAG